MKPNILVVDDQQDIRELISFYLKKEGYSIIEASNGEEALQLINEVFIDLMIVDVMMPIMDGFAFVAEVRKTRETPAIMLTAKIDGKDKLNAFSIGVDDYVTKPFDHCELLARIKAILKRCSIDTSNVIQIGDIVFDREQYEVRYKNEIIRLPLKQFELVFELVKKPNQIFSREMLLEKIWGMSYEGFDRTVDVHVKRIRENLNHIDGFNIVTLRGVGYKLEVK